VSWSERGTEVRLHTLCSSVSAFCRENFFFGWLVLRLGTGFLDVDTVDILGSDNSSLGCYPVHCKILSKTHPWPSVTRCTALALSLSKLWPKMSPDIAVCSWRSRVSPGWELLDQIIVLILYCGCQTACTRSTQHVSFAFFSSSSSVRFSRRSEIFWYEFLSSLMSIS